MLISTGFILALVATLYSDAQTLESPHAKGVTKTTSLISMLEKMDQKLSVINRAQEEQQRKLLNMEYKVNQVLSKLISLTHAKPAAEWNTSLERIEHTCSKMIKYVKFQSEQHSMLALLVTRNQVNHNEFNNEKETNNLAQINANNSTNQVQVEYFQPAKADCFELDEQQRVDGVYKFLEPEWNEVQRDFYERSCTFATSGPAWTIIQRRSSTESNFQLESFNRSWNEYRTGFGDLAKDFWFGNEFIYRIVDRDDYVLRIELEDQNANQVWAEYGLFRLDSESYKYQLVVGKLNENSSTHDALMYHNRMDFRTFDRNDDCNGWWFDHCQEAQSNLNGDSIIWGNWHNEYSVRDSRMLIRPRHFSPIHADDIFDEDSTY